ncbi:FG-GAP repeat domain-containing protein [Marinicella meishanensis]|uniref:FG-GAP repeat domain-containing protein n=1 Tax=Marinicella meishanensis TaxID=2873263 RepID=UPI001CC0EB9E|nr:VCBS repeat-containing protein [Marinicella sp. NBU2979]
MKIAPFRICWLLLMMGLALEASSQGLVSGWQEDPIHGPSQSGIADGLALDFNNDGRVDVVSVSLDDGHLRAYINQGEYRFEQQIIATNVPGAFRLVATDLNDDGGIDFVIPSIFTQQIIALMHHPDGHQKQIIAEGVLLPTDVSPIDFNNDGLMDLVSLSFEENLVLRHRQLPAGGFVTTVLADGISDPRKLSVADFNGDGLDDILVISSGDNAVRILENLGNTKFRARLISDRMESGRFVATCDINGDAMVDFVASANAANKVALFTNQGNWSFAERFLFATVVGPNDLKCHDLDDDGDQELITLAGPTGLVETHELNGSPNSHLVANQRDGYVAIDVGRFDGVNPYILSPAYFEDRNLLYAPGSTNKEIVVWQDFPDGPNDVVEADLNGDGVKDWVVASFRDDRVQWYDGLTRAHHIIAEDIDGAAKVVAVDLDQDGFVDVLSAASFANRFYWHRQISAGQFNTLVIYDNARFANGLAVGDINLDGQLDVIGTSGSDDSVRWFDRNGMNFTAHLIDNQGDAPNEVKALDIDQDGGLDLVVPYTFSNELYVYYNLGGGLFAAEPVAVGLNRVDSTTPVDLNEDGLMDLLVAVTGGNTVIQLLQRLHGGFDQAPFITSIITPKKLNTNGAVANQFLFAKSFPESIETNMVYRIRPVVDNGGPLFEQSNITAAENVVFRMTLVDLIYQDGFEIP